VQHAGRGSDAITTQQRFTAALEALSARLQQDRTILAAILCGSLSHDVVWDKSDIDLGLITIDGRAATDTTVSLNADGINVHAFLMTRTEFRKTVESALHNSFFHSLLSKGRVLYSHDETIGRLHAQLTDIGADDTRVRLLRAGMDALAPIDKAHKWLVTRNDLNYCALWILYAATPLAQIEVISRRLLADREVIPQAAALNPALFETIYTRLLNEPKTRARVEGALAAVDTYVAERAPTLFAPVLDHLRDVAEVRSCREIDDHFKRHFNLASVSAACEYLADRHLIAKAAAPIRLTKSSAVEMQELAFVHVTQNGAGGANDDRRPGRARP
jgi:hypothetical protein